MLGLVGGGRAGPSVPVAAAPGALGRPSTAAPGPRRALDDRWRRSPIPPIPTASSHPGSRVRAALTRGQDRRRCGPDRPSTPPTGKPSSRTPRPGSFPLPKRPTDAVVGSSSSGEGRTPARRRARPGTRGRARSHARPASPEARSTKRRGTPRRGGQPRRAAANLNHVERRGHPAGYGHRPEVPHQ